MYPLTYLVLATYAPVSRAVDTACWTSRLRVLVQIDLKEFTRSSAVNEL